ncbi:Rubisco LSMT substrate-binding [Rhizoctonia solani]|uniref:Rubisco LSMT substrate-binding n=1 Tax=Rhizoctonia solani TaxID=456999 RepID=A0A8H7I6G1_9AGAM|nr:Rubisco LSMT substrate-binding [Rhizoctonia solani]
MIMSSLGYTLLGWFKSHGGTVDEEHMRLGEIEGCGLGAIAVKDIPKDHVLFEIPRNILLSTRTCGLKSKMSAKEWQGLGKGWTPLILCMMWEAAKGNGSIWEGYLDKIGREEAEKEYIDRLVPLLKSRPDLFLPSYLDTITLWSNFISWAAEFISKFSCGRRRGREKGTRRKPQTEVQEGEVENEQEEEKDGDSDSEDGEKVEDVAMVPMADMLNARYGGENAKLFYEPHVLKMVTTKAIAAGDQIWNTYGDPPNSDLLRRYGYVDEPGKGLDIVEIQGSLVVECAASYLFLSSEQQKERVGWWLEMGGDDTFTLDMTTLIPPELLSFTQLLLLSDMEWEKTQEKEKPPKPKSDSVKKCVKNALERRMEMYSTTIEEDEHQLSIGQHTLNKRHALIIRIGEKKVLKAAIGSLSEPVPKKRKAEPENGARKKGARQK